MMQNYNVVRFDRTIALDTLLPYIYYEFLIIFIMFQYFCSIYSYYFFIQLFVNFFWNQAGVVHNIKSQ